MAPKTQNQSHFKNGVGVKPLGQNTKSGMNVGGFGVNGYEELLYIT
jgi:hypothetical protein